jgi:hypothetical protein
MPAIDLLIRSNHDSLNLDCRIAEAIDKVHQRDNPNTREIQYLMTCSARNPFYVFNVRN